MVGKAISGIGPNRMTGETFFSLIFDGLLFNEDWWKESFPNKKNRYIPLQFLVDNILEVTNDDEEDVIQTKAREYLLYLLGSAIFSDKSGTLVSAYYLELLMNLDTIGEWKWGAGALAYLYHQMGMALRDCCKQITGFLPFLEVIKIFI